MDAALEQLTSGPWILALRVTPVLIGAIRVVGTSVTVAMIIALGINVHASQPSSKRLDIFGAAGHRMRGWPSLVFILEDVP